MLNEMMVDRFLILSSFKYWIYNIKKIRSTYFVGSDFVRFLENNPGLQKSFGRLTSYLGIPATRISVSCTQSWEFLNWYERHYMLPVLQMFPLQLWGSTSPIWLLGHFAVCLDKAIWTKKNEIATVFPSSQNLLGF